MARQRFYQPGPARKSNAPMNTFLIKSTVIFLLFFQLLLLLPLDGMAVDDKRKPMPQQQHSGDNVEMRLSLMVRRLLNTIEENKDPADQLAALYRQIDTLLAAFKAQKAQFDQIEQKLKQMGASKALDKHYRSVADH